MMLQGDSRDGSFQKPAPVSRRSCRQNELRVLSRTSPVCAARPALPRSPAAAKVNIKYKHHRVQLYQQ
ncbi:hypothetical protein AV530_001833 [Patagioenas fasciata monilis]|uniref:Uncharacterized protein n=1 Tax=Patagioenas fasciata monilis TaxID=372326 RepID=A0A1V4JSL4_PATFA|nr:hypothetical protein AV530_001833 [Patagioenas fasciata monilis]